MAARFRRLRRAAPWLIAGVTLAALLYQYPLSRIVDEMQRGDLVAMVPPAFAMVMALWLTSTTADYLVLRPVVGGLRWRDLLRGKAGVSVLNALGAAFNYGGHGLWYQRRFGCAPGTAVGIMLFITLGDLFSVSATATAAVWLADADAGGVAIAAPVTTAITLVLLLLRPRATERPVLAPWRDIPHLDRVAILGLRILNIAILVAMTWAGARAFGLPVPFDAVATYLPVLLVIAALPVNVGGMGPIQAAWVAAFSPWAPGPQILAFLFLWGLCGLAAILLRGAPFLRQVSADIVK